jgi:predicted glycogen debranching enzyme
VGSSAVSVGPGVCHDPVLSGAREWLESNGRGSYAMGPLAACATRRYHGFLTIAQRPPLGRFQLINRLEESLLRAGSRLSLSCQSFPGAGPTAGPTPLDSFRLDPFPTWTYVWGDSRIEKTYFLRYGEDTGVVTYRLLSGDPVEWAVRPLLSFRDHHALGRRDDRFDGRVFFNDRTAGVDLPEGGRLNLWPTEGTWNADPLWFHTQHYAEEDRRGMESVEDVFGPGFFQFPLAAGKPVSLIFSVVQAGPAPVEKWTEEEREQRQKIVGRSLVRGALGGALALAADQFIVSRGEGTSVLAGYPWLADWSREALVSFPGLFLATGRWSEAPAFLDTFARHFRQGLLPNFFPEGADSVSYNAADAPLWFVRAVQAYHTATHDDGTIRKWVPVLRDIVDAFQNGAGYDIHMEGDGLVVAPSAEVPLTWMGGCVRGKGVTPRAGKPVEIQALWYNALQFLVEIQMKLKESTRGYDKLAEIAHRSFNEKFWNESGGYLYDVVDGKHRDESVRPNALLALSLPYEILEEKRFRSVVDVAQRELLTPRGLRTLASSSPGYRGHCEGNTDERDGAAHQGTVWPWLMGPFVTSYVKAYGATEESKRQVRGFLQPFAAHLTEACVGQISQKGDGDAPHTPRGCPAQAWSAGELLRVMWEEGITL